VNPRQALDIHRDVMARMSHPYYHRYMDLYQKDVVAKGGGAPLIMDSKTREPSGKAFCDTEARRLSYAETYYVSTDMGSLAVVASQGLDALDRFSHDQWPSDYGFLVFEDALVTTDVWGRSQTIKAISWGRNSDGRQSGTMVVAYADVTDPRDDVARGDQAAIEMRPQMGTLHVDGTYWVADDMRVGPPTVEPPKDYDQFALFEDDKARASTNVGRIFLALLMLLDQTIVEREKHDLMPKKAVHARRMNLPAQVTTIRLRRRQMPAERPEGVREIDWQHRWFCKGHWRSVPCGPNHPLAQEVSPGMFRARLWIGTYAKNLDRDDLPWLQTEKVYALVR
jgi:hypothetical protein